MEVDAYQQRMLDALCERMIRFYEGDPKRIGHLIKVHAFAHRIGLEEGLDANTQFILEAAAYTHDIGIRIAEEKYGRSDGELQEKEGPLPAQHMLAELGFENYMVERICYLIGHHHTYREIDGEDYQILVEADFLVNIEEDGIGRREQKQIFCNIFRTGAGKRLFGILYRVPDGDEE